MSPRAQAVVNALGALASALTALGVLCLALALQWVAAGAFFAVGVALVGRLLGYL